MLLKCQNWKYFFLTLFIIPSFLLGQEKDKPKDIGEYGLEIALGQEKDKPKDIKELRLEVTRGILKKLLKDTWYCSHDVFEFICKVSSSEAALEEILHFSKTLTPENRRAILCAICQNTASSSLLEKILDATHETAAIGGISGKAEVFCAVLQGN